MRGNDQDNLDLTADDNRKYSTIFHLVLQNIKQEFRKRKDDYKCELFILHLTSTTNKHLITCLELNV